MICLLSKMSSFESCPFGRAFKPIIQFFLKKSQYHGVKIKIYYLLSMVFILAGAEYSFGASNARFIVSDTIIPTHQEARIQVRLMGERIPFITRPVSGERVQFLLNDKTLGLTLTGGNGIAKLTIKPLSQGLHKIQVQLVNSDYRALPSEFLVGAFNLTDPIVLIMTSSLMLGQPTPSIPIPGLGSPLMPPARPHAAEMLTQLEPKLSYVYLTHEVPLTFGQQKKWFETFAFPQAPLINAKGGTKGVLNMVKKWKEDGWKRLDWLVTDSKEEAQKISDAGIPSIHLTPKKTDEGESDRNETTVFTAFDWKEVGKMIKKQKKR